MCIPCETHSNQSPLHVRLYQMPSQPTSETSSLPGLLMVNGQPVLQLKSGGVPVRGIVVEGKGTMFSVYDFIWAAGVCTARTYAKVVFNRLLFEHKEEFRPIHHHKFPGSGQHTTPCMHVVGLRRLLCLLGDKIGEESRALASEALARIGGGDAGLSEVNKGEPDGQNRMEVGSAGSPEPMDCGLAGSNEEEEEVVDEVATITSVIAMERTKITDEFTKEMAKITDEYAKESARIKDEFAKERAVLMEAFAKERAEIMETLQEVARDVKKFSMLVPVIRQLTDEISHMRQQADGRHGGGEAREENRDVHEQAEIWKKQYEKMERQSEKMEKQSEKMESMLREEREEARSDRIRLSECHKSMVKMMENMCSNRRNESVINAE